MHPSWTWLSLWRCGIYLDFSDIIVFSECQRQPIHYYPVRVARTVRELAHHLLLYQRDDVKLATNRIDTMDIARCLPDNTEDTCVLTISYIVPCEVNCFRSSGVVCSLASSHMGGGGEGACQWMEQGRVHQCMGVSDRQSTCHTMHVYSII